MHNPGLRIESIDIFAIVAGVGVALIAFFGCCGVYKENICLLTTYSSVLIALVIIQIALAAVAFLTIGDKHYLEAGIRNHLKDMYDDKGTNKEYMDILSKMQTYFECCGVDESKDMYAILPNGYLMNSCCEPKFADNCRIATAYKDGCQAQIMKFLENNFKIIGGIAVAAGVAEVVGAIIAICVKRNIMSQQNYV
ncbi:unnamed protein product [Callosobruchus maculatus]|nr:unnamed protein product [Callosobruchus maculatus]